MADKKEKPIEDYKQMNSEEIESFQEIPLANDRRNYCNLLEFHDLIPKYDPRPKRGIESVPRSIERVFTFKGKKYSVSLFPARMGDEDVYPGRREELIEDALRKIAMESGEDCKLFDGMVGLKFTIRQLQRELKNNNCTASWAQIKKSLEICAKTVMEIKAVDGRGDEFTVISAFFQTLMFNSRIDYLSGQKYCFLRFYPLVTRGITKKFFRLYHYAKGMSLRSVLSSYLYKRLCYNFVQAGFGEPYDINLTTLIMDAGLPINDPVWRNFSRIKKALKELEEANVVKEVKYIKKTEGRKLVDVKIYIEVTDGFSAQVIKSNWVSKELGTNGNF